MIRRPPKPTLFPYTPLSRSRAAQELKRAMTNEVYNIHWGPVSFRTEAKIGAAYTDNVFLSHLNKRDDYIIHPEVNLTASMPVRSEEHTSELQSQSNLVCRLL